MILEKDKLNLSSTYWTRLQQEFYTDEYGETKRFFFPDDPNERSGKFMLWFAKRYGVEDQYIEDLLQIHTFETLKHQMS